MGKNVQKLSEYRELFENQLIMEDKKIICSYMDIVHVADVLNIRNSTVFFQDGKNWMRVKAKGKISYQAKLDNPNAGSIITESIATTADTKDVENLLNGLEYYIVRLFIGNDNFLVGNLEYPAKKTYSDDKIRTSFTFTRISPKN